MYFSGLMEIFGCASDFLKTITKMTLLHRNSRASLEAVFLLG